MNVPAYLAAIALAAALQAVAYLWVRPRPRVSHWFAASNFLGAWTLYAILARVHPAHWGAGALILLAGTIILELLAAHDRRTDLVARLADLEDENADLRLRLARERQYETERGARRGARASRVPGIHGRCSRRHSATDESDPTTRHGTPRVGGADAGEPRNA